MANYTLTITMEDETVNALATLGMHLYAFKAVGAVAGTGGKPLVWFRSDTYSQMTRVSWQTEYEAYSSQSEIEVDHQIQASASYEADLGEVLTITGDRGTGEVTNDGDPRAISIRSTVSTEFACGISQDNGSGFAPICALPIHNGFLELFVPIEKVLVAFATDEFTTGTVRAQAFSPGLLVDFTGVTERTVTYDIDKGWEWGGATWGTAVQADEDLVPLLIEGSAGLELARVAALGGATVQRTAV